MTAPVVVFPDVEAWAVGALKSALAGRSEAYASGVTVSNKVPGTIPARLVQVRRDGGARLDVVRDAPRLAVNVWASSEEDATDLASLVRALLWAAPDGDPVQKVVELSGPSPVPDTKPRRYMLFQLNTRGTQTA